MEITKKPSFKDKIKNLAFKEKSYFLNRREINWASLTKCGFIALGLGIFALLLMPSPQEPVGEFHEQAQVGEKVAIKEPNPTEEATRHFGGGFAKSVPSSLNHLYAPSYSGGNSARGGEDRNRSMILARGGLDAKTQLPPGSRISVRLYEKAIVAHQGMPIIGVVTRDYIHEDTVAIPQDSKLFGEITFNDGGSRASVTWNSVQFPDGRERPLSGIGVSRDGQVGVVGRVHSQALRNTLGQTLTRFIGAYASGSMQTSAFGGNVGGNENGWRNAIAETAKDRAEDWANDLQKEQRWIEVSNRTEFFAVLTANFAFRDPGTTYGQ